MKLNKRSFLKSLSVLPFIPFVNTNGNIKNNQTLPNNTITIPTDNNNTNNIHHILTPDEISQAGFIYVPTPTFKYNNQIYTVRIIKTKLTIDKSYYWKYDLHPKIIQYLYQINFTHIHSVFSCPNMPIINPITFDKFYPIFAKGVRIPKIIA